MPKYLSKAKKKVYNQSHTTIYEIHMISKEHEK